MSIHYFAIHGESVCVDVDDDDLRALLVRHLRPFGATTPGKSAPPPNIAVSLSSNVALSAPANGCIALGTDLRAWDSGIGIVPARGVRVRLDVGPEDGAFGIHATVRDPLWRHVAATIVHGRAAKYGRMLKLIRYGLYYPLFLRFQVSRGMSVIHAAAVERDGSAVLIAGLNGCGKSTLALAFAQLYGFALIADNFVLSDGCVALAIPEELRVGSHTRRAFALTETPIAVVNGKARFAMNGDAPLTGVPNAVILPSFSEQSSAPTISRLPASRAAMLLDALHFTNLEAPEFAGFAAAAPLLFGVDITAGAHATHATLSKRVPVYSLSMPRGATADEYTSVLAPVVAELSNQRPLA